MVGPPGISTREVGVSIDGGLRGLFRGVMTEAHWVAVETGETAGGVPDSNYCFPGGVAGWVEYKRTDGIAVRVRPGQVAWIDRRTRLGDRVSIAVVREVGRHAGLYLYPGDQVRNVADQGIAATPAVFLPGLRSSWDWAQVRAFLTREILLPLT